MGARSGPATPSWIGGKAAPKVNRWLRGLIPATLDVCYCEPFAGMLGMLLSRRPARAEVVTDTSRLVSSFWLTVLDAEERAWLADRLAWTPTRAAAVYEEAVRLGRSGSASRRELAWALVVIAQSSMTSSVEEPRAAMVATYRRKPSSVQVELEMLADRMRDVQVLDVDGVDLAAKVAARDSTLIYCDPPYADAAPLYGDKSRFRRSELLEALLGSAGMVVVSGGPGDWPELDAAGWHRASIEIRSKPINAGTFRTRTEACWRNAAALESARGNAYRQSALC